MSDIDLVEGDNATLRVTCLKKGTQDALDLTNKTVALKWYASDGVTLVTKAMTIATPATDGIATYKFADADLYGTKYFMEFEVVVTDSGGEVISGIDTIKQRVRPKFA